ncbi:organic cation transporter protein-like [Amphiura filiformis]|uniref:organic cation transporter protein-like n=1 Tax=Amphiura filiformis TaxID=82378 RepID=UPI003B223FD3
MLTFDDFIPFLGAFGPYQRRVLFLACIIVIPNSFHVFAQVFFGATTDHWCSNPRQWKDNCSTWGFNTTRECEEAKKAVIIPPGAKCSRYDLAFDSVDFSADLNATDYTNITSGCEDGWTYDRSQYTRTIIHDFDLVCDRAFLPDIALSVFGVGPVVGTFVFGWFSDWNGRRPAMFIGVISIAIFGTILAFSVNYAMYITIRFFIGMANTGLYLATFVWATEFVGPSKRTMVGVFIANAWAVGYMLLSVLAYFFRDWRTLELVISVPMFLYLFLIPFFPESARWLLSKGDIEKARPVIEKAATCGNIVLPESIFEECDDKLTKEDEAEDNITTTGKTLSLIDIMRYPNMRWRTLNMMFNWWVNSMVYYGLSLSTSSFGVNDYLAAFVSAAVEIPAYTSSLFVIEKWGRRVPVCVYLVVSGVACIMTTCIPVGIWKTCVAMIGKFSISASYGVIYIYATELFPTPVRSSGLGACCMASELSGIVTPLILTLGLLIWGPLPLLIFGGAAVIAGILTLLFPETMGEPLQETMEESEAFGKKKKGPSIGVADYDRLSPTDRSEDKTSPANEDDCAC